MAGRGRKKRKLILVFITYAINVTYAGFFLTGKYFYVKLIFHRKKNTEFFFQIRRLPMKYKYLKGKMNFRTVYIFICLWFFVVGETSTWIHDVLFFPFFPHIPRRLAYIYLRFSTLDQYCKCHPLEIIFSSVDTFTHLHFWE